MKNNTILCGVIGLLVPASSLFANITTYNAVNDFPTVSNSTIAISGPWSYGYSTTLNPVTFSLDLAAPNYFGDGNASGFSQFGGTSLSTVLKNTTGATIPVEGGTIGPWPSDLLLLHPNQNGNYAVVQFTAPTSSNYVVSGLFIEMGNNIDPNSNGVTKDSIIQGNTSLFFSTSSSSPATFSFTTFLAAGQTLDFLVGLGPDHQYNFDSTGFNATISATPEPGFYGILGLGLAGLTTAIARRKRA